MGVFDDADALEAARTGQPIVPAGTLFSQADQATGRGPPPKPDGQAHWWDAAKGAAQTVDDAVRAAANTITFGMADRLAGNVPLPGFDVGRGTEAEVKKSSQAIERSPYASLAGGLAGAVALPGFGAEALAARYGGGMLARMGAYGGVGAATGAAQGAGNTYTGNPADYAQNALIGGAFGGALGSALPPALAALGAGAKMSQVTRLRDATKVADEQISKVARDAGVEPAELVKRVTDANAAGQPYAVADALGKEGQRKLTALAKVPGAQREAITEALTARDLNLPNRVGAEIGQALGAPGSAAANRAALINRAGAEAAPVYRQAERVPTWSPRIQEFLDDPIAQAGLRQGVEIQRLRNVGTGRPFNPRDAAITHFNEAGDPVIGGVPNMVTLQTLKTGLDRMIENEINPSTFRLTQRGAALSNYRERLLAEIDSINPRYAEARRIYSDPMRTSAAIETGQNMAQRGRAADTVPAFQRLSPNEQQGVRIGYADKVLEPLEKTGNYPGILREKSLKGQRELDALSLYQGPNQPGAPSQLRQRLNREETMKKTSNQALGGSSTIENAADVANTPGASEAMGVIGNLMAGRPGAAVRSGAQLFGQFSQGQSPAQRDAITRALLETDPNKVQAMAQRITEQQRRTINPFLPRPPRLTIDTTNWR